MNDSTANVDESDGQSITDTISVANEIEAVLTGEAEKNLPGQDISLTSSSVSFFKQSIYKYASHVQETLENPRQTKLERDMTEILGSSDPPAGFGFLQPRFYQLEQQRPTTMEPLQVWRGYNGNVYFTPIQVQRLDNKRDSIPSTNNEISISNPIKKKKKKRTTTNAKLTIKKNESKNNNRSVPFIDGKARELDLQQASSKMWQSVVTCAPFSYKPISKRSQQSIEDLQAFQQEQSLLDPTGYHRQVLPNIRPVAKSKFVYKGLAYKESQKFPGIGASQSPDRDENALQKPLVAYNLAQAYARYEIDAARAKQNPRPPPPPSAATGAVLKEPNNDLRDKRKRIVKGTTLSYRPPGQSMIWTPGRADPRSTILSEASPQPHRPSTSKSSIPQKQTTVVNMPLLTKYVNPTDSSSRHTHLSDLLTGV